MAVFATSAFGMVSNIFTTAQDQFNVVNTRRPEAVANSSDNIKTEVSHFVDMARKYIPQSVVDQLNFMAQSEDSLNAYNPRAVEQVLSNQLDQIEPFVENENINSISSGDLPLITDPAEAERLILDQVTQMQLLIADISSGTTH